MGKSGFRASTLPEFLVVGVFPPKHCWKLAWNALPFRGDDGDGGAAGVKNPSTAARSLWRWMEGKAHLCAPGELWLMPSTRCWVWLGGRMGAGSQQGYFWKLQKKIPERFGLQRS